MKPELHVLGLSIKTFGLAFAFAFVASGVLILKRLRELGKPPDWAYEMVFSALVGGIVGARGYYLVQHFSMVKHDLIGSTFSGSGLVWYGGLLGGAIAVLLWAWRRGWLGRQLLDASAPSLAIGYAVGRIGCQISGDGDYGKPFHGLTAMGYPHGTLATPPGITVYPTPIYETVAMSLVTWILWRTRDHARPGMVFALYLLLSGIERLLIEFIRRNAEVVAGLTAPQLESIGIVLAGAAWLAIVARRSGGPFTAAPAT